MTRKALPLVATAAVGALVLAACGGGSDSSADGRTTITFLHAHNTAFDDAIAAFEEAHPDIKVEQEAVPFDEMISQVQARLGSADDSLDVVAVDPPRLPNMVEQGFLDPVGDEAVTEMDEVISDVAVDSVTWEEETWAYPVWTSDALLFYNKEALTAAGVEFPGADVDSRLTWEQVLSDAQTVQDAGAADYGFAIEQVNRYYALQPIAMSMGAGTGLEGEDGLQPDVTSPEWLEFGEWYGELFESGLFPRGVNVEQMPTLFQSGQIAYWLGGPTFISKFEESEIAGNWGMAPHPYFEGGDVVTPTDSWAVGVSAHSSEQEAAHTFAEFVALTSEGSVLMSENDNLPPVHQEAYDAYIERMTEVAGDEVAELDAILTIDNQQYAAHRPRSVGYVEFETTMNDTFSDIAAGGDPVEILETAQATLERQLERYTN